MNWTQTLWMIMAVTMAFAVTSLVFMVRRRQGNRSNATIKTVWFIAATTSGTMLVSIAAKVIDVLPNATVIDVGALAITGILTGLFLAFALTPTHTSASKS